MVILGYDNTVEDIVEALQYDEPMRDAVVHAVNSHDKLIQMLLDLRKAFYVEGTTQAVRDAFASINDEFNRIRGG